MIDIHNKIYTILKTHLQKKFKGIIVQSPYQDTTASFPCVTFEEIDNTTEIDTTDSFGEFHSNISFEINIYTDGEKKRNENRAIREEVDLVMNSQCGMNRISMNEVPNYADMTVHRYVMRYNCVVDKYGTIYRR